MEGPSPPARATIDWCDDDRDSIHDGVGVDEKWERQ